MSGWLLPLWLGAAVALAMAAAWWWQRRHANAGIVDVVWAAGVGAAAVFYAIAGDGAYVPRVLLAVLGGIWGLRLAWFLWRRVRSEAEDGRYRQLRAAWNGHQGRFFGFFQLQAVLVVLFSLPLLAVARNPVAGVTAWTLAGVAIWIGGVLGEALADRQLARFRAEPANRGRVCDIGLWRWSRHPNYFFEWLHWFAYVCLAVGSPIAWLAWSGPVVMYLFLRWISGIPWTEAQALRTRGAAYRDYQRRTPMLIPWFPKPAADTGTTTNTNAGSTPHASEDPT
jgi:steroid 5-alpha reductase family enzyme